jgi:hypothetical protein
MSVNKGQPRKWCESQLHSPQGLDDETVGERHTAQEVRVSDERDGRDHLSEDEKGASQRGGPATCSGKLGW